MGLRTYGQAGLIIKRGGVVVGVGVVGGGVGLDNVGVDFRLVCLAWGWFSWR